MTVAGIRESRHRRVCHDKEEFTSVSRARWNSSELDGSFATSCPCGGGCPTCSSERVAVSSNDPRDEHTPSRRVAKMAQPNAATGVEHSVPSELIPAGGTALGHNQRRHFEQRFGVDLGHVRIHTDAQAAQLAAGLESRAYTVGSHIVFGDGELGRDNSHRLLAHELVHVLQGGGGGGGAPRVSSPDHPSEQEADRLAAAATAPGHRFVGLPTPMAASGPSVRRARIRAPSPWHPLTSPWVLVELHHHRAYVFEDARQVRMFAIHGGRRGHETRPGEYRIDWRDRYHRSSAYGHCVSGAVWDSRNAEECDRSHWGRWMRHRGHHQCLDVSGARRRSAHGPRACHHNEMYVGADMAYFQRIYNDHGNVGFHRGNVGASSHGCIHVGGGDIAWLWDHVGRGTHVVVCDGDSCAQYWTWIRGHRARTAPTGGTGG